MAIVAKTVKGWGAAGMHGAGLHGKAMMGQKMHQVLNELAQTAHQLEAAWDDAAVPPPALPPPPRVTAGNGANDFAVLPSFAEALRRQGKATVLVEKGAMSTRLAYGLALRELGHACPGVVALDGDVSNSTYAECFSQDAALAERFFEARIAEQNMVSCAVGLAAGGKIPFASSFGKFMVRAYDQLEMALISRSNIKLVGSHSGVSLAADGPSQMALADLAFLRAYTQVELADGTPALVLFNPADAWSAYALTRLMAQITSLKTALRLKSWVGRDNGSQAG